MKPVPHLSLLEWQSKLRVRDQQGQRQLWDPIRKRYVSITPEEVVRQLLVIYLLESGRAVSGRISIERKLEVLGRSLRYDLIIHGRQGEPLVLVECKAPDVPIDRRTLQQISRYNLALRVPWLILTNGHTTFCLQLMDDPPRYEAQLEVPMFNVD